MTSIAKQLKAKAHAEYEKALSEIPERTRVYDLQKQILSLWTSQGVLRSGKIDTNLITPYYLKLQFGLTDRLDIEVPFFTEEIEDRFSLEFHSVSLVEDSVRYDYNPHSGGIRYLSIFFLPRNDGKCRIISEETEVTVKKFKSRVVCG